MNARALSLVTLLLLGSGCYSYHLTSVDAVSPGDAVRLRLTQEQAALLSDGGSTRERLLEGTILERTASDLLVETTVRPNRASAGTQALVQKISVPVSGFVEIEQRTLDGTRTGIAMAAGGVGLGIVIALQVRGGSGQQSGPGTDTNEARRIPLIRVHVPF